MHKMLTLLYRQNTLPSRFYINFEGGLKQLTNVSTRKSNDLIRRKLITKEVAKDFHIPFGPVQKNFTKN